MPGRPTDSHPQAKGIASSADCGSNREGAHSRRRLSGAPERNNSETSREGASKKALGRQKRPASYLQLPGDRIPRLPGATPKESPAISQEGANRHYNARKGPAKTASEPEEERRGKWGQGPDQRQQEYWMKNHGTKRVKRDHRGREKDLPGTCQQERTRGPPRPEGCGGPHTGPNRGMPTPPRRRTQDKAEEETKGPKTKNRRGKQSHKWPLEGRDSGQDC